MNDPQDYTRQIETYLCQKNGGHLVRVVGPAFELVRGWASSGIPLKIAMRGIDRCCERQDRAGRVRRRPVRVEFCEADVLEAFDEWRRAVGVTAAPAEADPAAPARKPALASHIERAIARLAHARGRHGLTGGDGAAAFDVMIDDAIRELEILVTQASRARGEARAGIVESLRALDARLLDAALSHVEPARGEALAAEAAESLAAFRDRMPGEARERARQAAYARLVRESSGLPTLAYE